MKKTYTVTVEGEEVLSLFSGITQAQVQTICRQYNARFAGVRMTSSPDGKNTTRYIFERSAPATANSKLEYTV